MTDKSATERLRELLEERGVEYEAYRDIKNRCITKWRTYHGAFVFFAVEKEGKLFVETASDTEHSAICTPEQAIAVTLGVGECEVVSHYYYYSYDIHKFELSCGHSYTTPDDISYLFCPNCGKKVVSK